MVISRILCCHKNNKGHQKSSGLTLIEVLIALSIVAIALTAVIKATSENLRSTTYLQNKTCAMWVAQKIINEVRAGLIPLQIGQEIKDKENMGGKDWYWSAGLNETSNSHIQQINVKVFADALEESQALITLEGYLYHAA